MNPGATTSLPSVTVTIKSLIRPDPAFVISSLILDKESFTANRSWISPTTGAELGASLYVTVNLGR